MVADPRVPDPAAEPFDISKFDKVPLLRDEMTV